MSFILLTPLVSDQAAPQPKQPPSNMRTSVIFHSPFPSPIGIQKQRGPRVGSTTSITLSALIPEVIDISNSNSNNGNCHIHTSTTPALPIPGIPDPSPLAETFSYHGRPSEDDSSSSNRALAHAIQQQFIFNTSPIRVRRITKMLQRSKPQIKPLMTKAVATIDSSSPLLTPEQTSSDFRRSPSATPADVDEVATAVASPGLRDMAKRKGMILTGGYAKSGISASSLCVVSSIDTSPLLLRQSASAGRIDHLATPTDSNPERSASLDCGTSFCDGSGSGDSSPARRPSFSVKSMPASLPETTTLSMASDKIPFKPSSSAHYCPSPPPAYCKQRSAFKNTLRRTRSQSPTPQPLSALSSIVSTAQTSAASTPSTKASKKLSTKAAAAAIVGLLDRQQPPASRETSSSPSPPPPPPPPLSSHATSVKSPSSPSSSSSSKTMFSIPVNAKALPLSEMDTLDLASVVLPSPPTSGISHNASGPWSKLSTTEGSDFAGERNADAASAQDSSPAKFHPQASHSKNGRLDKKQGGKSNGTNAASPNSTATVVNDDEQASTKGAEHASLPELDTGDRPPSTIIMVAATADNINTGSTVHNSEAATKGDAGDFVPAGAPATRYSFVQAMQNLLTPKPHSPNLRGIALQDESGQDKKPSASNPEQKAKGSVNASESAGADLVGRYEKLMLRSQDQRNSAIAEANSLQQQLAELQRTSDETIRKLKQELETTAHKLCVEYELRTAAETRCALMECELAELSSHIQFEAQNLVAQERREHKDELDRMTRKQAEIMQLMEMEREQVASLKQSLESANTLLDKERSEAERLRTGMLAFERQMSNLISPGDAAARDSVHGDKAHAASVATLCFKESTPESLHSDRIVSSTGTASAISSSDSVVLAHQSLRQGRHTSLASTASHIQVSGRDPHITGVLYFGNDATRLDTRLTEFLGFLNSTSDKEAMHSTFMQRSLREDVVPTLAADSAVSGMPSLSGWNRHRRLLHAVQDNTLILETFSPRVNLSRVLSLGCYLCGCSANRPSNPSPPSSMSDTIISSTSNGGAGGSGNSDVSRPQSQQQQQRHRLALHRMRFNDNDEDNKPLCYHCHGRMVSVCSFFAYLKIVRKGLIKRPIADIWLEVSKARLHMWLARSGASPESTLAISFH